MSNLDTIIELLPNLNKAEMQKVQAAVAMLAHQGGQNGRPASPDVLLGIICELCREERIELRGVDTMKQSVFYKGFVPKAEKVMEYVNEITDDRLKRIGIIRLGLHLLIADLRRTDREGVAQLMQNIHRLPACLDKQFPGYARLKLLHLVIREED